MTPVTCPLSNCTNTREVVPWTHPAGTYGCGCGAGCVVLSYLPLLYGGTGPTIRPATPGETQAWQEDQK